MNNKDLINKLEALKGAKFASIKNYVSSSTGEISNVTINLNTKYANAVLKDIEKLNSYNPTDLTVVNDFGIEKFATVEDVQAVKEKLLTRFLKNQNEETASNQSIAQKDAYIFLAKGLKYHKESGALYIHATVVSKVVVQDGEPYKKVNSGIPVLVEKHLSKVLKFSTAKYRNYKLTNLDSITVTGETFENVTA